MNAKEIKIKFVKKAGMWCKTTISYDEKGKKVLTQFLAGRHPGPDASIGKIYWSEYHHKVTAESKMEAHERESLIHEEVMQALRPLTNALPIIDNVRRRLEIQEAKLRPFAETFGLGA